MDKQNGKGATECVEIMHQTLHSNYLFMQLLPFLFLPFFQE
jgi:hypothetical protein